MSGVRTITILLVLSLLGSSPLLAVCEGTGVFSGAYRESALDVDFEGNDLWVATSYGVTLYDRSTAPPRALRSLALPGPTSEVEAVRDMAVVASGSKLYVVRKENPLRVIGSLEIGGTINDILEFSSYLFVAATNGVAQVDLINPAAPIVANRLTTTTGSALALARFESTLFAADGDNSVEIYTVQVPSFPQKIGTLLSLPRSSSVAIAGTSLFVSDGQQTQIFSAGPQPALVASLPSTPASSAFLSQSGATFVAGSDRRIRALDLGQPARPVTLWQEELPASGGTLNRVLAVTGSGSEVYVAAGDIGFITVDASKFTAPFAIRLHPVGAVTSAAGGIITADAAGGLTRYALSGGHLQKLVSWEAGRVHTLHDVKSFGTAGVHALTSSASTLFLWSLDTATPTLLRSGSFRTGIRSAALTARTNGTGQDILASVVLNDRSFWLATPNGSSFTLAEIPHPASFVVSDGDIATAELTTAGTTVIRFFPGGDLTVAPQTTTVEGAATTGIALSGRQAIVSTFRGISVADFTTSPPTVSLISTSGSGTDLEAADGVLFFLRGDEVEQWDLKTRTLSARHVLPAPGLTIAADPADERRLLIATESGLITLESASTSSSPLARASTYTNVYGRKILSGDESLFFFHSSAIERFRLTESGVPQPQGSLPVDAGVVDFALVDNRIFTLSSNGKVSGTTASGAPVSFEINDGTDVNAQKVHNIAGALHVSYLKGCTVGACEKKTVVLDPRQGLVATSTYGGGILDFATQGTNAWLLLDLPREIRLISTLDPYHPTPIFAVPSAPDAVSIAYASNVAHIYVLGQRLDVHDGATLQKKATILDPYVSDSRVSYLDQRVRVADGCAIIAGRKIFPELYSISAPTTWTLVRTLETPAAVKGIALDDRVWHFLTDYSLEVFSSRPPVSRKRPVR
jgi:hypothetical protein